MLIFLGQNVKQNIIMVTVTLCAAAFGWQIDTVSLLTLGHSVLLATGRGGKRVEIVKDGK